MTFCTTSHGKGPCDGVGGTIKRLAARESLRGALINTPLELYECAKANVEGIYFCYRPAKNMKVKQNF